MLELVGLFALAALIAVLASAAEVAVFAPSQSQVERMRATGSYGGRALASLRARPFILLATVWTLRIGATALAAIGVWEIADLALSAVPAVIVALAATVTLLMVAEFLGRTLALRGDERLAAGAAMPLWLLSYPLLVLLWPVERLVLALSPGAEALPRITDREIRDLVSPGNGEPAIEEHERRLIQRAFLLDQTTAYDVMTPRVDMFAWPESRRLAGIAPELRSVRYSRVPLYRGSIDEVTGVLYARDAYQALISGQRDVPLRALAREPFFVPGSVTLDRLLLDFQSRRIHMGIVIDEYGGTDGLITLEDILEELVGEIVDETDIAEEPIIRVGRNEILVNGNADLREINHFFNTTFPQLEHRSLNGYLLDVLGRVPQAGEKLVQENVLIEVLDATDTQVMRARLIRQAPRLEETAREDDGEQTVAGTESGSGEDEPSPRPTEGHEYSSGTQRGGA